jgi:hypothetical protein
MTRLSPEARRLLQLARIHDEPSAASLRRIEHSLATHVAQGIGATATGALWAKSASGLTLGATKAVAIVALGGAVSAAGYWALPSHEPAATVTSAHAKVQVDVPRQSQLPAEPSELSAEKTTTPAESSRQPAGTTASRPTLHAVTPSSHPITEATETADELREETRELRSAQQALRAGNAGLALELLTRQDQTFQGGLLQQERSAARVLALCQSGHADLARSEAKRFEQRWPKSPLVARVRTSCL